MVWGVWCVVCGVGCGVSTHHPCCGAHLSVVCVVMAACDDSACLVLSHCVVGCGMAAGGLVACLSFFLFLFVLVFGVVRAQLCEHARYPRTPLCSFCCLVFSSSLLLCSPPFFVLRLSCYVEWRWGVHHVSVCCVGMTATGSLSLSSSFFW